MTKVDLSLIPPVDTLTFSLADEQAIKHDTVKITVDVHALKGADTSEADLRLAMLEVVKAFIATDDWRLSQARRETQATGNETATVTATVRVHESENYGLKERAEQVSRPGLTLAHPRVDASIPNDVVQAAESSLRKKLLEKAVHEATVLSGDGMNWAIHKLDFGDLLTETRQVRGTPLGAVAAPAPQAARSRVAAGEETNASSTLIKMSVAVMLRRA
ncbi:hypothetical protein AA23498_3217 [Acetobacter nitrogenifigens DSM 23921 = NBRC 105050]|uniref:SIMPL domain-containing protein n=1 Tax=Acetobacter nitrogenifigens DSM 23921 = NBRC 105050 TaxID=1120919 RepID=A0A511X5P6_9PROT|nr:hypothetical protein [Acetobacter nitrogenifigens]GBQ98396.1 hypothetical protein AA23498_3217 [Acetobacter nitrogenifigens DSM 23921 = NBRC 105050]GEN58269.1 hypothetical protein ANI02nite_01530 [Acetobacter nitrogenifigens DSM 23921 = NBRC 105050]